MGDQDEHHIEGRKKGNNELGETQEDENNEGEILVEDEPPIIDLSDYFVKPDQFEGIHILDEKMEILAGAPNFRQLPGFPIFGTGQPTESAIIDILKRTKNGKEAPKVIWFKMRQEPVVYVDGSPYAPRAPDSPHGNLPPISMDSTQLKIMSKHLTTVLKKRMIASGDNTIEIHKDKNYSENPMERVDMAEKIPVKSIKEFESILKESAEESGVNLVFVNVPIGEDQASFALIFDNIISALKDERASTPCVFSAQMGRGRTTLGMAAACLIKEIQLTQDLK